MLLDSDILVDLLRGRPSAVAWIATLPGPPYASGFAALEMAQGTANLEELRRTKAFLADFPLLWPSSDDMARAYEEYAGLRLSHGLGLLDSLIASTAIGHGELLATFNARHFRAVPSLTTIQPYER